MAKKKEKINTGELLRNVDIVDVVREYVQLKKDGRTYKGLCPYPDHHEKTPSFDVDPNKQIYACFGCGRTGDAIAFLTETQNMGFHDACRKLGWNDESEIILQDAIPPSELSTIRHPEYGNAIELYPFRNYEGQLLGYTARFQKPDGKKQVLPYTYKYDGDGYGWHFKSWNAPRPMYGLDRLRNAHTVAIFEGEKTADHAHRLIGHQGYACLSWVGGSSAAKYVDFSPIELFPKVYCPDNDTPGEKVARIICDLLIQQQNADVRLCEPVGGKKGADVADTDWNADQLIDYVSSGAKYAPIQAPDYSELMQAPAHLAVGGGDKQEGNQYFRCLGFETVDGQSVFHFFTSRSSSLISLSASKMTSTNLLQLAPLKFWELNFMGTAKEFNVKGAQDWLIENGYQVGMFNVSKIRGRGAWIDKGDVVLHSGEYLIVNGQMCRLTDYQTQFVYDRAHSLQFPTCTPATSHQAVQFLELSKRLRWERPLDAYLLVGWCVIAPVCGALNWRPHIWVTGPKGSGKSWVFSQMVVPMLGEAVLNIEGNTSEAGIRQSLQHDAIPVVYDEAEGETKQAAERIQTVLGLARSASSENGAAMLKGSAGGESKSYKIRSCFAFASITVQAKQQSDRSRISVLSLRKPDAKEDPNKRKAEWESFQRDHISVVTPDFVKAIQSRTITLLPTILKNIKAFTAAAAVELGEQRSGDQVGAMLAGAFALTSDKEITFDQALEWIRKQDWTEEKNNQQTEDEKSLLARILEEKIMAEDSNGVKHTRRIGELVDVATLRDKDDQIGPDSANTNLSRHGIKIDRVEQVLIISNTDREIQRILEGTPWTPNHHKVLLRLDGAYPAKGAVRFKGGSSRAVCIPFGAIPGYNETEGQQELEFEQTPAPF